MTAAPHVGTAPATMTAAALEILTMVKNGEVRS